jgi:RNA polymerase sigma-70 factor (ECF subfamily)
MTPGRATWFLDGLAAPKRDFAREWDLDHDRHVLEPLLAIVQPSFGSNTRGALPHFAAGGQRAARVSEELGLWANAVLQAKSRVLERLREETGELQERVLRARVCTVGGLAVLLPTRTLAKR